MTSRLVGGRGIKMQKCLLPLKPLVIAPDETITSATKTYYTSSVNTTALCPDMASGGAITQSGLSHVSLCAG